MTARSRHTRARANGACVAAAMVAIAVVTAGCCVGHYHQASCSVSRHSILPLEAQAVPSATFIPCLLLLPAGWSYGGTEVRSGLGRFWVDSDQAGGHAAEVSLMRTCNLAAATEFRLRSPITGLRGYEARDAAEPRGAVRYFVFAGGCVIERFSFTRQTAPALFAQADQFLGFTPRSVYVNGIRHDNGLTLCGAEAPPCPG